MFQFVNLQKCNIVGLQNGPTLLRNIIIYSLIRMGTRSKCQRVNPKQLNSLGIHYTHNEGYRIINRRVCIAKPSLFWFSFCVLEETASSPILSVSGILKLFFINGNVLDPGRQKELFPKHKVLKNLNHSSLKTKRAVRDGSVFLQELSDFKSSSRHQHHVRLQTLLSGQEPQSCRHSSQLGGSKEAYRKGCFHTVPFAHITAMFK